MDLNFVMLHMAQRLRPGSGRGGVGGRRSLTRWERVYSGGMAKFTREEILAKVAAGERIEGDELHGAHLSGQDLSGANLSGTNLTGANLTGAIFKNTTMPDGTIKNPDP